MSKNRGKPLFFSTGFGSGAMAESWREVQADGPVPTGSGHVSGCTGGGSYKVAHLPCKGEVGTIF